MVKPFQLGRGLGSLIPRRVEPATNITNQPGLAADTSSVGEQVVQVPISELQPNPQQPRQHFDHAGLEELVASVKMHGILQPLIVSRAPNGGWQLIAGERRLRAAQVAGLSTVPAIVRSASEQERLELSLVENIQRQDLNPLEEAQAFKRLHDEFSLTQESIAQRLGKSRSQVANTLRLLELPPPIRQALAGGQLTLSHAKVILSLESPEDQERFFRTIVRQGLSVRETSWGIKRLQARRKLRPQALAVELKVIEDQLRQALGTKVRLRLQGKIIKVEAEYYSVEELRGLVDKLTR